MRKIISLLGLLLVAGCAQTTPEAPHVCSAASFYFTAELSQFSRNWYEKHLRAMGEPSLSCGEQIALEQYRFLWLRSFEHPIAVRVSRTSNGITLETIELDGQGGYAPGDILRHYKRMLGSQEWRELKSKLDDADFWNMPSEKPVLDLEACRAKNPTSRECLVIATADGAAWLVEGRNGAAYHLVDRVGEDGRFTDLGLFFLKLSGFSIPEKEIY